MKTLKKNKLTIFIGVIVILIIAILIAALIIKYTYHRSFIKNCYSVCYYNKGEELWEYRPWGYGTDFIEEDRDFPSLETCLSYCLPQKQIDFIKSD